MTSIPGRPKKDSILPVRLDAATKQRLAATAAAAGLTTSALVRILLASFLRASSAAGGRLVLFPEPPGNGQTGNNRGRAATGTAAVAEGGR